MIASIASRTKASSITKNPSAAPFTTLRSSQLDQPGVYSNVKTVLDYAEM